MGHRSHRPGVGVVEVKRVYDDPDPDDGARLLVDGLWPRGLRKDQVVVDEWLRDIAPSKELRRWYGHKPDRFPEFAQRYRAELREPARAAALSRLRDYMEAGRVTLLTSVRELPYAHTAVLQKVLTAKKRDS